MARTRGDRGASAVEYALLAAGLATAVLLGGSALGHVVTQPLNCMSDTQAATGSDTDPASCH